MKRVPDPTLAEEPALRAWAAEALERGRATWPAVSVSRDELMTIARVRTLGIASTAELLHLHKLDAAELYLAAACMRGDPDGLRALREHYYDVVAKSLQRIGIEAGHHDDAWQILCERLLLSSPDTPPRIVRYAGSGELRGLLRVAATRLGLNWRARDQRQVSGDLWLGRLVADVADPELHSIKSQHRAALKEELQAAVATLRTRERVVLRMHLVERLNIDTIARLCSMHRATAARIVRRTRDGLIRKVRARLVRRWQVDDSDLLELRALIDSQLDLSLARLLETSDQQSTSR